MSSALAGVVLASWLSSGCGPGTAPAGQPPMVTVTAATFDTIRTAFNQAKGQTRVILLLSPT